MVFTLLYHPAVAKEDIPQILKNLQRRIATAIETRLTDAPERYGTPLRKTLKGYWKLRVGDYRVLYKMRGDEVVILGIQNRKAVYEGIVRRIGAGSS